MRASTWVAAVIGLALVLASPGCRLPGNPSPPTRLWVLDPLPDEVVLEETRVLLLVGPFMLPGYLDRRELVSRGEDGDLRVAAFDSWAADLSASFKQVLAINLEILVPGTLAAVFPWKGPIPGEYQLAGVVTRFDVGSDRAAYLAAQWRLIRVSDKQVVAQAASRIREPIDGEGTGAEVAALSRALGALAREIAVPLATIE